MAPKASEENDKGSSIQYRLLLGVLSVATAGNCVSPFVGGQHRERVLGQLEQIRAELAASRIETAKSLAEAIQELKDHGRRLENLESHGRLK